MAAINTNPTSYGFGPFRLIPDEHQLLRAGTPIPLPPKTFETLVLLVENSGHLIEKDQLMQTLWPDSFVEEANAALKHVVYAKLSGHPIDIFST